MISFCWLLEVSIKNKKKQNFTLLLTNYLSMGVLGVVVSIVSDLWRNFLNFSLFELSELFSILSESHNAMYVSSEQMLVCSYLFSHLVGDNYWLRPKSPKRRIGCITSVSTIDMDCRVYTLVSVLHPKDYPINLFANIIFKNWYKLIFLTIKSFWMLEFIGIRSCLLFLLSCL